MMVLSVKLQEIRQWYLLVQNVSHSLASNVSRLHLWDLRLFLFIYVRFGLGQLAPTPLGSGAWWRYLWWKQGTEASKRSHSCTCNPCADLSQVLGVMGGSILLFLSSGLLTSLRPDVRHWCFVP